MSVFSGLSRLRNSFRRKNGRVSETSKRIETSNNDSQICVRTELRSTRTEHSASSSPEEHHNAVPRRSSDQGGIAIQNREHNDTSPRRYDSSKGSSNTSGGYAVSKKREQRRVSFSETDHDIVSTEADYVQIPPAYAGSRETTTSGIHAVVKNDCDGRIKYLAGNPRVSSISNESDELLGCERTRTSLGHKNGAMFVTVHAACPSLKSSSSSLTATNRHSKCSVQDMDQSTSTSDRNSTSFVPSDGNYRMGALDGNTEEDNELRYSCERLQNPDTSAAMTTMLESDDGCERDSNPSIDCAVSDSNESGDNLPFADAFDRILDAANCDISFRAVDGTANDAEKETTSNGAEISSDQDSLIPVLRRKQRNSNQNRVSFGTNLQEVLGKAEDARDRMESKTEDIPSSCNTCEIPQTLKESPSLLALHKNPVEDLICRVCNEMFYKPLILPCLHTFCSACIKNLQTYPVSVVPDEQYLCNKEGEDSREVASPSSVHGSTSSSSFSQKSGSSRRSSEYYIGSDDQKSRVETDRVVLCPTCLKETTVSATLEELPKNYLAERRVAHHHSTYRGVVKQECDSCGEHGNSSVITSRCVDCSENLCSLCELSHRRQKKTKRHQLFDVISASDKFETKNITFPSNKTSGSQSSASQTGKQNDMTARVPHQIFCNRHTEEELKLFCFSCDFPVCRDCVVMDHRDHECQFLSGELFRGEMKGIQQLIRSVVPKITAVDQQLKKVSDTQDQIQASAEDVTRDIHAHMDSFESAIHQHRRHLTQQVGVVMEEKQHALHVAERQLRQIRADVEHTCRFVSDLIEYASDVEILSVKRLVTERLTSLQDISATQHQPVSSFMRFCPSEKGNVINNFQMFGRVISRKASAAASTLFTEGLSTARVGHESSVVLRVNSEDGTPYGGKDVQTKAWLIFQDQSIRSVPVSLSMQKNGAHCLRFTPVQTGSHFLHVAVQGQPIMDSPFKFKVKGQWRQHKGAWHCCTVCSTGGRMDVPCACRGAMPGGHTQGCSHTDGSHPGGPHWSCCGKMTRASECPGMPLPCASPIRQVTL